MPGIYDALQQAQRDRDHSTSAASTGGAVMTPMSAFDQKLTELYQSIVSAVDVEDGRAVLFAAPLERVGADSLLTTFASVVARKMSKSVLVVNVAAPSGDAIALSMDATDLDNVDESIQSRALKLEDCELYVLDLGHAENIEALLNEARRDFELILLSVPSLEMAPILLELAGLADGVVMVVESERTRWQAAASLKGKLEKQGGRILGVLLNKRKYYIPRFIYNRI